MSKFPPLPSSPIPYLCAKESSPCWEVLLQVSRLMALLCQQSTWLLGTAPGPGLFCLGVSPFRHSQSILITGLYGFGLCLVPPGLLPTLQVAPVQSLHFLQAMLTQVTSLAPGQGIGLTATTFSPVLLKGRPSL